MNVPQFGEPEPGREHRDRPAAFGIAVQNALIAAVRVEKPGLRPWIDLPGGALDLGEIHAQAVIREFGEETGLRVSAGEVFAWADQLFVNTEGAAYNNRAAFLELSLLAEAPDLKIEGDHTLLWLDPHEAISVLRHDAHAWAVAAWLRRHHAYARFR